MDSTNRQEKTSKYLSGIKVDADLYDKLMEQYEAQKEEGIPYKGEYFGMVFTEGLRAYVNGQISTDTATAPEMEVENILAKLDQRNRQRRQLWAVSIIMFILFFIAALFAWKYYHKYKEEVA